MITIVVRK